MNNIKNCELMASLENMYLEVITGTEATNRFYLDYYGWGEQEVHNNCLCDGQQIVIDCSEYIDGFNSLYLRYWFDQEGYLQCIQYAAVDFFAPEEKMEVPVTEEQVYRFIDQAIDC